MPPAFAVGSPRARSHLRVPVPTSSVGTTTTTTTRAGASVEGLVLGRNEAGRRSVVQEKLHLLGQYEALLRNNNLSWEDYVELAFPLLQEAVGMLSAIAGGSSASLGSLADLEKLKGQLSVIESAKKRGSAGQGHATAVGKGLLGSNQAVWMDDPAPTAKPSLMTYPKSWEGSEEDEPIRVWLTSMADWLKVSNVAKSDAVGTAATYLCGKAQVYWLSMVDSLQRANKDPTEWGVFRETMILAYGAHDYESTARTKIYALRQTGSVQSYVRELQLLFAELTQEPMHEADKVHRFFAGMHPPLAARSQLDRSTSEMWTTFADAAAHAIRQDALCRSIRFAKKHAPARITKHNAAGGNLGTATPGFQNGFRKRKAPTGTLRQGANSSAAAAAAAAARGDGSGVSAHDAAWGSGSQGGTRARGGGWTPPSKASKQTWFAEGKCLLCGSTQHRKAECPRNNTLGWPAVLLCSPCLGPGSDV